MEHVDPFNFDCELQEVYVCCYFVIRIDLSSRSLGDILWDEKDQWTGVCPVHSAPGPPQNYFFGFNFYY